MADNPRHLAIAAVSVLAPMFDALTDYGVVGRAHAAGLWRLHRVDPRDYAHDRHRSVDDRPYGGGPGMVMSAPPLARAIEAAVERVGGDAHVVCTSPQGRMLRQGDISRLAARRRLVVVCGRYEGVDERLVSGYCDEEVSLGDFVMSGGEFAAMAMIDAMVRLIEGALHHADSAQRDSFALASAGVLDCPHYTRPEVFEGQAVPAVLLGGDHGAVDNWRIAQAVKRTALRRPELLQQRRREGLLTGSWRRMALRLADEDE